MSGSATIDDCDPICVESARAVRELYAEWYSHVSGSPCPHPPLAELAMTIERSLSIVPIKEDQPAPQGRLKKAFKALVGV